MLAVCAVAVAAVAGVTGCSGGGGSDTAPTAPSEVGQSLLVIGSGSSNGEELGDPLREAWPRVLFGEMLPPSTTLVNGASGPSTVAEAIVEQVPLADELRPDLVAVWLGSYDLNQGTPPEEFGTQMRALIGALAASGSGRVFVADLPRLPAYDEELRVLYNDEIAAAVLASDATLVPLRDETLAPVDAEHDYQPDAAGHRLIAEAFADSMLSR